MFVLLKNLKLLLLSLLVWSLRSNEIGSLSGLEAVLTCLQPSTFGDDQLSRFRGLCLNDVLDIIQQNRELPKISNRATKSTLTSTTAEASAASFIAMTTASSTECISSSSPRSVRSAANRTLKPQLLRQSTQQDYSSRIKVQKTIQKSYFLEVNFDIFELNWQEWTQEKRARLGLVRTMSERSLDRKMLIPPSSQQADQSIPESPVLPPVTDFPPLEMPAAAKDGETIVGESFLVQQQPPPAVKSEQRRKEALWDLFQSECAFLYDHIMVLKNVSLIRHKSSVRSIPFHSCDSIYNWRCWRLIQVYLLLIKNFSLVRILTKIW